MRTVKRETSDIRPWEEERDKNGVKTEKLAGSGLIAYPGRSCCAAEMSEHTNTVCNILQQRQQCRHFGSGQFAVGHQTVY